MNKEADEQVVKKLGQLFQGLPGRRMSPGLHDRILEKLGQPSAMGSIQRRARWWVGGAAATLAALALVVVGTRGSNSSGIATAFIPHVTNHYGVSSASNGHQRHLDPSYAYNYGNLTQLTHASSAVVVGQVTTGTTYRGADGILYTDYEIAVTKLLGGTTADPTIVLHVTGGTLGNTKETVTGLPMLKVGQQVVVFAQQYAPDHYHLTGNPEALWLVNRGTVVSPYAKHLPAALSAFQRTPLQHFIANIP